MTVKPKTSSAVDKLQRSRLNPAEVQRELMGDDIDLTKLIVYLKSKIKFNAADMIQDVSVSRTVEGASTVIVTIIDAKREVLRSGLLNSGLDIQLGGDPGIWFRLVKVGKQGDLLSLTFEDREIAILRTYKKFKVAHRSKVTRAEFVNSLIREVKELDIPVVIPELHKVQPILKTTQLSQWTDPNSAAVASKEGGIPESYANAQDKHRHRETDQNTTGAVLRPSLTVQGVAADREQIRNANIILATGVSMGARRKVLVVAMMVAIQESWIRNLPYGDRDSLGLFQQRTSQGWGSPAEELDPATSARMFFNHCMKHDAVDPTRPYWDLAQATQVSANGSAYALWRTEGDRLVAAYGIPGGDTEGSASDANNMNAVSTEGSNYIFYRGQPMEGGKKWKKEDSWTCIQRLAEEVGWRAFFVSGVFYFIPEDDLFKSKPIATITEFSSGVEALDGDYDEGKPTANVSLTARVGTWLVPPGAIVVLQLMGPWNGRWLVNSFTRSLFDSKADIVLKKPQPRLPEPAVNDINQVPTWAVTDPAATDPTVTGPVFGGTLPANLRGTRAGIQAICDAALAAQAKQPYHYNEIRPYPTTLWSNEAHVRGIDCSGFATLVYKEAGCPDPNQSNFDGNGYTGTLIAHGLPVAAPSPGDLVFYLGKGSPVAPGHVAVFVGNGQVVEIGSENGILKLAVNYRSDIIGYRSYIS